METPHWPLFGLRVHTPRVTLRYPDDADAVAIAELAAAGIHDPAMMPFSFPWTDLEPPLQQRRTLQHLWSLRAEWRPEHWNLDLAVVVDDSLVGVQSIGADDFAVLKAVMSGSWLGHSYQGKGIGTEMRAAVLHLAFDGLGAEWAHSGAFTDNAQSQGVSRKLGYEEDGRRRIVRRGEAAWLVQLRLSRERWLENRRDDIVIEGLEQCLAMFGAA
jgi:RimJ/RimL family protein N-acetyltransferase